MTLTKRYVSSGAERLLGALSYVGKPEGYTPEEGNDSGLLALMDYMGGDETVVRVATAGHGLDIFPERPEEPAFLRHLAAKGISAPFKSVQFQFAIQAPIEAALAFVYSQRISVNEYSGRYSVMLDTSHLPSVNSLASQLQGEGIPKRAEEIQVLLQRQRKSTYGKYQELIQLDLARELARAGLGIDNDTKIYWKTNIFDLAEFVSVQRRLHTPGSITREYVEAVAEIASVSAPHAWKALMLKKPRELNLTMPRDEDIVDPSLSPAAWEPQETKRRVVDALEEILFAEQRYLGDGAFQVVDYLGDDSSPADAARVSYGKGTRRLTEDRGLVRTLIRDLHTSPIEMPSLAFEGKTPVFVDPRQAARHRTLPTHGFMGYTPLGSRFFVPGEDQLRYQDRLNRQGRGKEMEDDDKKNALKLLSETFTDEQNVIAQLRELGAPESVVRSVKGVGFYTRGWRAGDSHNLGHFLGLRLDSHAQKEIRDYAVLVDDAHKRHTPIVNEALKDYHINGMRLSEAEVAFFTQEMDLSGVDPDNFETYRGLRFVRRRGDGSEFLNLDGQGLQRKLRLLKNGS